MGQRSPAPIGGKHPFLVSLGFNHPVGDARFLNHPQYLTIKCQNNKPASACCLQGGCIFSQLQRKTVRRRSWHIQQSWIWNIFLDVLITLVYITINTWIYLEHHVDYVSFLVLQSISGGFPKKSGFAHVTFQAENGRKLARRMPSWGISVVFKHKIGTLAGFHYFRFI